VTFAAVHAPGWSALVGAHGRLDGATLATGQVRGTPPLDDPPLEDPPLLDELDDPPLEDPPLDELAFPFEGAPGIVVSGSAGSSTWRISTRLAAQPATSERTTALTVRCFIFRVSQG
jgi:hypothetical protein